MFKRFIEWLKSLLIPTKAPIVPPRPPGPKPQGGGGPGEEGNPPVPPK